MLRYFLYQMNNKVIKAQRQSNSNDNLSDLYNPKLRELLEAEFEARLENDPYLSEREKRAIVGQISPERKEKDYER